MPTSHRDPKQPQNSSRDRYDYVVLAISFLAIIVASLSAAYTAEQACISQDQEYRTLRPYLVLTPEVLTGSLPGAPPKIKILVENVGATPVYDFVADLTADINLGVVDSKFDALDCSRRYDAGFRGKTFLKTYSIKIGPPESDARSIPNLLSRGMNLFFYGSVCYQDSFGRRHKIRLCYSGRQDGDLRQCQRYPESKDFDTTGRCDPFANLRNLWRRILGTL